MKCLREGCDSDFDSKTSRRKFCSDSCKMKHYRKHGKKTVASKFEMQVFMNDIKAMIQNFMEIPKDTSSYQAPVFRETIPQNNVLENVEIREHKTAQEYVKERMEECDSNEAYQAWLKRLDSDPYLSKEEKKLAKISTQY